MANRDIFTGSGASITFVPETTLYFPISAISGQNLITAHSNFSDNFSLVNDLYVGCVIEYYDNGTFTSSHRITANTATTITFSPAISSSISVSTTDDYFHILGYGAPVPAPKATTGTTHTSAVTTVTFNSDTKTDYDDTAVVLQVLPNEGGTAGDSVVFIDHDGNASYSGGVTPSQEADISPAANNTREEYATIFTAAVNALSNVSATRSGAVVTITNTHAGTTTATTHTGLTGSASTDTGITIANTLGTSVTTTTGKRLLSDQWLGIVESATFPTTEVETKQVNLSLGGSRNKTFQYKGIETASGANIGIVANHAAYLYYFLGRCTAISATNADATDPTDDGFTGLSNDVYFDPTFVEDGPLFYRTVSTDICPPILKGQDALADIHKLTLPTQNSSTNQIENAITYTFAESNSDTLPSFALEQVFSKLPSSNTYRTNTADAHEDTNFVKIARGNRVNTLTLTANENEEIKMTMDLNTRTVHSLEKTEAYDARRAVTDESSFFNYGSANTFLEPFFFSSGHFKIFGEQFLKINTLTLTMNNNLQDRRFIGVGNKSIKEGIPAERTYEISFTGHVTDDRLYTELLNADEHAGTSGNELELKFTKDNGEEFTLAFQDYMISANNFPIPDDKGAVVVEATVMPRTLSTCTVKTHWILQG